MDNLNKSLNLLGRVSNETHLLLYADRVELKRQRSGHYRLYIACIMDTKAEAAAGCDELAEACGFTANPYKKAGVLTSVSFADNDEPTKR
jgi:hypothetical protein